MRANYLREQYESGEIIPVYCPGAEQAADLLTKALAAARITELAAIWGLLDHSLVARHAGAMANAQPYSAGAGALVQQDLRLSTLAVLLAFTQFVGTASQGDEELEDISIPVSLNTDLMLAVAIVCIGICFIAVWEFLKWCFETACSRRLSGWGLSSVSSRRARKLQRLRDQTAQAIEAELLAREEAASSSTSRPSQPARSQQARGAPTRFYAAPEGTKLHRTKTCSTLRNTSQFIEYQVCQQCHSSQADCTQHRTR